MDVIVYTLSSPTNSKRLGGIMFKIKISDGFCEYEYPLNVSDNVCIHDIYVEICKAFKLKEQEGKCINYNFDGDL